MSEPRKTAALIDLGYLYRRNWHASASEEMSAAKETTLGWIARETAGYDYVAVCKDSPPYKRSAIYPAYKAQREAPDQVMLDQYDRTVAELERWGYVVVGVPGYEADDVIATLSHLCTEAGVESDIYTADKDMAQCATSELVSVIDPGTGDVLGKDAWEKKFGGLVPPSKIPSWLALVGDSSDNLPGIQGCGPKTAAKWLTVFENITDLVAGYSRPDSPLTDRFQALLDVPETRKLLQDVELLATVYTDLPLTIDEHLQAPCAPVAAAPKVEFDDDEEEISSTVVQHEPEPITPAVVEEPDEEEVPEEVPAIPQPATQALVTTAQPWERQLEPATSSNAWKLAMILHDSQLYSHKFKSPNQILAVMLEGRARGLDSCTALRNFSVIKGNVGPSAGLLVAMVMNNPNCTYFRCVESTTTQATWETHRKGHPEPDRMTFTIDEAKSAGYYRAGGPWQKIPKTMLRWRAATELARMVYPDVCAGLYSTEELGDF